MEYDMLWSDISEERSKKWKLSGIIINIGECHVQLQEFQAGTKVFRTP